MYHVPSILSLESGVSKPVYQRLHVDNTLLTIGQWTDQRMIGSIYIYSVSRKNIIQLHNIFFYPIFCKYFVVNMEKGGKWVQDENFNS